MGFTSIYQLVPIICLRFSSSVYCDQVKAKSKYGINTTIKINKFPVNIVNER